MTPWNCVWPTQLDFLWLSKTNFGLAVPGPAPVIITFKASLQLEFQCISKWVIYYTEYLGPVPGDLSAVVAYKLGTQRVLSKGPESQDLGLETKGLDQFIRMCSDETVGVKTSSRRQSMYMYP